MTVAQEKAEKTASIATGDRVMDAFVVEALVQPPGVGILPAVVLIHDGEGVNEEVKAYARRIAGAGHFVIAPDIRHRLEPAPKASSVDLGREIVAAISFARKSGGERDRKVAVVGLGAGGFVAFLGACRAAVTVAIVLYGGGIERIRRTVRSERGAMKLRAAPVRCIFGAEDALVSASDVGTVRERFVEYRVPHEFLVYPRVGADFLNDQSPGHRPVVAADAWDRILQWLRAAG